MLDPVIGSGTGSLARTGNLNPAAGVGIADPAPAAEIAAETANPPAGVENDALALSPRATGGLAILKGLEQDLPSDTDKAAAEPVPEIPQSETPFGKFLLNLAMKAIEQIADSLKSRSAE